jgi:hypothetical protein
MDRGLTAVNARDARGARETQAQDRGTEQPGLTTKGANGANGGRQTGQPLTQETLEAQGAQALELSDYWLLATRYSLLATLFSGPAFAFLLRRLRLLR